MSAFTFFREEEEEGEETESNSKFVLHLDGALITLSELFIKVSDDFICD